MNTQDPPALPPRLRRYLPDSLWSKLEADPASTGLLLNALHHLRAVQGRLSAFLPEHLIEPLKREPRPGANHSTWRAGSLLFCDVSGFTALSEQLAAQPDGAELLTAAINDYFEQMLDILARSGGSLLKFAGDALLAYFPAQANAAQTGWAIRAAHRMMRAMERFAAFETAAGPMRLRMKIGLSTGEFMEAGIGNAARMEYIILGATVARTLHAEGQAQAGQIVADAATVAALVARATTAADATTALTPELYLVHPPTEALDDFEIKAETGWRRRSAALWESSLEAIQAEIVTLVAQLDTLSPYLPAPLVAQLSTGGKQRRLPSEFRPAAILFGNVTGFEALLTPDSVAEIAQMWREYLIALHEAIAQYGGILSRIDPYSNGSKLLILFGAPVAHEDDPHRALHTALALHRALAALNTRWQRRLSLSEPPIRHRFGVTYGRVFTVEAGSPTRHEYTVMGDEVNLAARLMSAAQPGQTLASAPLHAAARDAFAFTALPAIMVKGKQQPIPLHQLDGLRAGRLARRLAARVELIEREEALLQAKAALQQALSRRQRLLTITGPAGSGKSQLLDALAAHAQERGARVYLAECTAYTAAAPYAAWIALLHALADSAPGDPPEFAQPQLQRLLTGAALAPIHLEPLARLLGWPELATSAAPPSPSRQTVPARAGIFAQLGQKIAQPTIPPSQRPGLWQVVQERQPIAATSGWQSLSGRIAARERERLFAGVEALLNALASQSPLLLLFENAQWMDTPSQELLAWLCDRPRPQPFLIARALRPPLSTALCGASIALEPLSPEGSAALVAHLLGEAALPAAFGAQLHAHTGGNPLYIEELAHWLAQQPDRSPAALTGALGTSLTLQELVISRIDRLLHPAQRAIRGASVVGEDFAATDLAPVLEDATPLDAAFRATLDALVEAGLLLPLSEDAAAHYAFVQTLVREITYGSLAFEQRRHLHSRIAAHLESHHAAALDPIAELLAYHYTQAQQPLPAARYLLLAGRAATRRYAYPQARELYTRALALLDPIPPEAHTSALAQLRASLHVAQGDIALLIQDFAEAAVLYQQARALHPAEAIPLDLRLRLALALAPSGEPDAALAHARAAAQDADPLPALAMLAWLIGRAGAPDAAQVLAEARAIAEPPPAIAALLHELTGAWEAALQAYRALDLPGNAALAACRWGDVQLAAGDIPSAQEHYAQAAALCEPEQDAWGLALAAYRQAEAHTRAGDSQIALQRLEEARVWVHNIGDAARAERDLIEAALQRNAPGPWPPWRWQPYDDAGKVLLLFKNLVLSP